MKYRCADVLYEIDDACLELFELRRQKSCISRETGGQLFAQFLGDSVVVKAATETKGRSKRTRYYFWPDRKAEREDIEAMFLRGYHYIGDWHTHPENIPTPSTSDRTKMLEIFQQSDHELARMLMVIVGLAPFPEGLFVGAVDSSEVTSLHAENE